MDDMGIKITRDRAARTLTVSQGSYLVDVLTTFDMQDSRSISTPMEPKCRLISLEDARAAAAAAMAAAKAPGKSAPSTAAHVPALMELNAAGNYSTSPQWVRYCTLRGPLDPTSLTRRPD